MSWFDEKQGRTKRRRTNRRTRNTREPLLMVSARMSEQRRERRHRLGSMVLITLSVVLFAMLVVLALRYTGRVLFTENRQFAIRHFDLKSDGRLKPRHLREYANLREGLNLFGVDIGQIRNNLESVPLISSVEVRRQLPDTLKIRVSERVALARLVCDGGLPLAVDREGYVLGPSYPASAMPKLYGILAPELKPGSYIRDEDIRDAIELLDLCDTTPVGQFVQIASINVGDRELLDIQLTRGPRVLMARDQFKLRLRKLGLLLRKYHSSRQQLALVDATGNDIFPVQYR